jgi:DNA-binding MarR family transcriptional regulator
MTTDEHLVFRAYLDAVGLHGVAAADAAGLHTSEWHALSLVGRHGPLTAGDLATRTGLTTGATTRLVDRLERAGYVRRTPDPADRRKVLVEAVPEAASRIESVVAPARTAIAEVLSRYTPAQRAVLFDYFAHATPAFQTATDHIRSTRKP